MKLKDIFTDAITKIFIVTNQDDENELNWIIEPTKFEFIPEDENYYFVKAKQISTTNTIDCYIDMTTPERIAEIVVKNNSNKISIESIYNQEQTIIPAIASNCFWNYELFYAKENPQIGIDILKEGLIKATNKNIVAEDLGYILRDEGRINEAIEAFKISENNEPSSAYIYLELSNLYQKLWQTDEALKYSEKFKNNN